jgi:flagellar hook-associated protein 3 FlgL
MQIARVATFASIDTMVDSTMRAEATMATEESQESSGLVSTDYGGYGAGAGQIINLQVSVSQATAFADAATAAQDRASAMSSALTSISDLMTSFRTDLTEANSTDGGSTDLTDSASELLQQMASDLNTQYEGEYVFAGSQTGTQPVDISDPPYAAATATSSADTSYYQGDDTTTSVRVSDQQVVSYGITADNTAFEQALRAMNMVANSSSSTVDSATISAASTLMESAIEDLSDLQGKLSADTGAIESAGNEQTSYETFASTMADDLTNVDVAQVTAKITAYQSQLEASYAAIAKIEGLSLADYLK